MVLSSFCYLVLFFKQIQILLMDDLIISYNYSISSEFITIFMHYRTTTIIIQIMKQNQQCLDAINILKGIAYSQLMLEDLRIGLCQSTSVDFLEVFSQIDVKGTGKVYPIDLIKFLSVHRLAISQRQSEYLIYLSGSQNQYMDFDSFQYYFSNGDPEYISSLMTKSQTHRGRQADEMIKNFGEIQISKLYEKEIQFYRTIEKLKEQYIKKHGFIFKNIVSLIDREKKGKVDMINLTEFIKRFGVQLSVQQFQAIGRRIFSKDPLSFSYKEIMKAFSPFQPLNFPTYRKQNNFQKALDYINEEVAKLNINTQQLPYEGQDKTKTVTGFGKVIQNYRNPGLKSDSLNSKYFYDQNYYNQLKQYRTNFFNPNRDIKKKVQSQMIGPQYHDHFFSDYYLYLQERNKLEHYYNKFGKRYTFDNTLTKTYSGNKI